MEEEIHWCWSECCDLGPHQCICGNECGQQKEPSAVSNDDTTAQLARIANALELQALIEAQKNVTARVELGGGSVWRFDDQATGRWEYLARRIDQLTGYQEANHD